MAAAYPACRFLPHTVLDHGVLVGIQVEGKTLLAAGSDLLAGVQGKLRRADVQGSCREAWYGLSGFRSSLWGFKVAAK